MPNIVLNKSTQVQMLVSWNHKLALKLKNSMFYKIKATLKFNYLLELGPVVAIVQKD